MRGRTAAIVIAAALAAGGVLNASRVHAQPRDISGTWQGTAKTSYGREMRTVIKITAEGGSLRALWYSIDRTPQPFAATITLQGAAVNISIPAISGAYSGRVSTDGATITGSWTQDGTALPLNFAQVSRTGFGLPFCLVFRPDKLAVAPGRRYLVEIDGLLRPDGKPAPLSYIVEFVSLR